MLDAGMLLADPTGLRPPRGALNDEEQLGNYMTSSLYEMAGVKISSGEIALLQNLIDDDTDELVLDAGSMRGRNALVAFRKLEKKLAAYTDWRGEI